LGFRKKFGLLFATVLVFSYLFSISNSAQADDPGKQGLFDSSSLDSCGVDYYGELLCSGLHPFSQTRNIPRNLGEIKAIALSENFACVISESTILTCWGVSTQDTDWSDLPSPVKTRTNATQIWADNYEGMTVVYENRFVYHVKGYNGGGFYSVEKPLDYGSSRIAAISGNCVLEVSGSVRCLRWGTEIWDDVLGPEDKNIKLVNSTYGACALSESGVVRCWDNQDNLSHMIVTRGVIDIASGWQHYCVLYDQSFLAVQPGKEVCRWAWEWKQGKELDAPDPSWAKLSQLEGVQRISNECVMIANSWDCGKWYRAPNLGKAIDPITPDLSTTNESEGKIVLSFSYEWKHDNKVDPFRWEIYDGETKLCTIEDSNFQTHYCYLRNQKPGTKHLFKILGVVRSGTTTPKTAEAMYCPLEPQLQVQPWFHLLQAGGKVVVKGKALNTCLDPKSVRYRMKQYGDKWSIWKTTPLSKFKHFQISELVSKNSIFQFRFTDNDNIYDKTLEVPFVIKDPIKAVAVAKEIKQGFRQGGLIGVSFQGEKRFNGECYVSLKNDAAFNFALTNVGAESAEKFFKVKDGKGVASIAMRWNGQIKITTICKDPKFAEVNAVMYHVFKANF